jgi:hypothetical protein
MRAKYTGLKKAIAINGMASPSANGWSVLTIVAISKLFMGLRSRTVRRGTDEGLKTG